MQTPDAKFEEFAVRWNNDLRRQPDTVYFLRRPQSFVTTIIQWLIGEGWHKRASKHAHGWTPRAGDDERRRRRRKLERQARAAHYRRCRIAS